LDLYLFLDIFLSALKSWYCFIIDNSSRQRFILSESEGPAVASRENENAIKKRKISSAFFLAIGILALLLGLRGCQHSPPQEYAFPDVEMNVIQCDLITPVEPTDIQDGSGQAAVTYSPQVNIDLAGKTANVYFMNPEGSHSCLLVSVDVEDTEVAKTGMIMPGYGIELIDNLDVSGLTPGEYDGQLRVDNYNAETGEKAIMVTTLPVSITVS